jgi:hypothetical protein
MSSLHITPFILDQNNSVYIDFYTPTVAGIYSMSVTFGFAVEKMHVQMSPFAFEVRFSPTPRVVSCRFSDGGTSVVIKFSTSTDRGLLSNIQPCSTFIEFTGFLGNGCRSYWANNMELHLSLGVGASLIPGNVIHLKRNAIRAYLSSSLNASGSMNVVALDSFHVRVMLSSPTEISHCNDIELDVTSSTGSCGRPFAVSWHVSFTAKRFIEIQQVLNSYNGKLQARVAANLLMPGDQYLLWSTFV